jgi:hypothetical protein
MTTTNHTSPSGEDAANGAMPDTGNAEADRIINRLSSSDPDFDDCIDAVAFIRKLVAENKGPEGFATWKDAALNERLRSKGIEMNEKVIDTLRLAIGYIGSSDREDRLEHTRRLRALISSKNGAMGERVTQWQSRVRNVACAEWINITEEGAATIREKYSGAYELRALFDRAALTAEKVAGQEPVGEVTATVLEGADQGVIGWYGDPLPVNSLLYAAPQQPMQSAEPTDDEIEAMCAEHGLGPNVGKLVVKDALNRWRTAQSAEQDERALTDEQFVEIQEAREILENMVRSVELDGNYSTEATCTFLRQALLCLPAAQPESGGEA